MGHGDWLSDFSFYRYVAVWGFYHLGLISQHENTSVLNITDNSVLPLMTFSSPEVVFIKTHAPSDGHYADRPICCGYDMCHPCFKNWIGANWWLSLSWINADCWHITNVGINFRQEFLEIIYFIEIITKLKDLETHLLKWALERISVWSITDNLVLPLLALSSPEVALFKNKSALWWRECW